MGFIGKYLLNRINYGREVSRPKGRQYARRKRSPRDGPSQSTRGSTFQHVGIQEEAGSCGRKLLLFLRRNIVQ